jgi:hypothetical protein
LYYVVYNPNYWRRDQQQPFEVYRLVDGSYQLQIGEPFWMPEAELGIGRSLYQSGDVQREVLSWFDRLGNRYLTPEEQLDQERQRSERLAARLRELNIDPDSL